MLALRAGIANAGPVSKSVAAWTSSAGIICPQTSGRTKCVATRNKQRGFKKSDPAVAQALLQVAQDEQAREVKKTLMDGHW